MITVLFDVDGTILSLQEGFDARASSVMFKEVFGVDAHEEMIDNIGKTEMGIIFEVLEKVGRANKKPEEESSLVTIPKEAYAVWGRVIAQELKDNPPRVLPGISELLTTLSKNPNVKLGLLTGNSSKRAEAKLESAGLKEFFTDPATNSLIGVFGDMAEQRHQLFEIVKRQSTPEDRFIIVDDSLIGARMAQEHNIPIIMVGTGKATVDQLRPFTPHVFPDFGENRWKQVVSLIEKI